jgi:hypothetical protein
MDVLTWFERLDRQWRTTTAAVALTLVAVVTGGLLLRRKGKTLLEPPVPRGK